MADNLTLNSNTTTGKTLRTLQDASTVDWPVSVACYATTLGVPDALTIPLAAALADATANPTTIIHASALMGWNGTTWDRLKSTTANGLVVDVSRVQGTTAVSAASLPLPAGAATAAKQPALGTAGTASADVITVQGIASMTALKVDASATTQPVSGTITANAGTGTFTVQQSNITADYDTGAGTQTTTMFGIALPASGGAVAGGTATNPLRTDPTGTTTQPVSGTFWQVTQPISGTVTANIGTSGSLALDTSVNGVLLAQASTTSGQKGPLIQGAVTTAAPTYTTAQTSPLSLDTSGNLRVLCTPSGTQTVSGTVSITANSSVNVAQLAGTTTDTNSGVKSAGTLRVVLATDQPQLTNSLKVDGSGVTQPVSGTFWQATQPVSGTVSVNALPAGTNLIGQVSSSPETGTVYSGTTALTPKFAIITASSSGATTIVAAVTSKRIRVLRWSLSSNGAVNAKWQSHVTPTDLTGLHYLTQFASAGGAYCPVGIFQTVAGEALDINLSAAIAVGGELTYVEV